MSSTRQAIDLSHHLNELSRARVPSPLKDIIKYSRVPGMVSLAGGLPHPSLFPFSELHATVYAPETKILPGESPSSSLDISIPKYASESKKNAISAALQYGTSQGSINLSSFIRSFTARVMNPGYANFEILLNSGSTDAWNKVVNILCEFGDSIIVEEYTYPSAQSLWAPMGCKGIPVAIDKDGMVPSALKNLLKNWGETHPGVKQPHLMYLVPVGQNPTGATIGIERKKEIYAICVEYDIIIVEDDPYYFLQLRPYVQPSERDATPTPTMVNEQDLLDSLIPTFLSIDTEGRVIRLDTFSKTLGPGNRLGYFVCNPLFAERILRASEVTTQSPSGLSQALVEELLTCWGQDGFLRWVIGLRDTYTLRRDWMCDLLAEHFDLAASPEEIVDDIVAMRKGHGFSKDASPIFSFSYPKGGMFLWIKLYLASNSTYKEMNISDAVTASEEWTEMFWMDMIKEKVLLVPGLYYTPITGPGERMKQEPGITFFRLAFSFQSRDEMAIGIERMARVFERWWI